MGVIVDRPEVASPDGLNQLARRRDWPLLCDIRCRFTFAELTELLALWRSKAGPSGIPPRSEMTARLLKPYLTSLTLHERVAGPGDTRRYRVRLMGGAIVRMAGEGSGKFYDEFLPGPSVPIWNAMSDAVLGHGAPVRMLMRADELDKTYLVAELFAAPLLASDDTANLVLTAGRFAGNKRWEDVVAAARAEGVA